MAFSFLLVAFGCHSGTLEHRGPQITAATISADQLPTEFDGTRTYHYRVGSVTDPQGMLVALWDSGLESTRAWQPFDNLCFDPVGPSSLLSLSRDRELPRRIPEGDGRVRCATKLTSYTISPAERSEYKRCAPGRDRDATGGQPCLSPEIAMSRLLLEQ
jgi:hypothetical protein